MNVNFSDNLHPFRTSRSLDLQLTPQVVDVRPVLLLGLSETGP